jgi:hypothetical protein
MLIINQMLNAISAPTEAARAELDDAKRAAAAISGRIRLGELTPDMKRLDAEVKQVPHAI